MKKRLLATIATIAMVVAMMPSMVFGATPLSGSGTEADPYVIKNFSDLEAFRDDVNGGNSYAGKYVKLTDNIDLTGKTWTPIGNTDDRTGTVFSGTFDGGNFTISNISGEYGLFKYIVDGNVKDLTITANLNAARGSAGILSDRVRATSTISNVTVKGSITNTNLYTGGFVGAVGGAAPTIFKNCTNEATVSSTNTQTGGFVGCAYGYAGFTNCVNKGAVTENGLYGAGGIVGFLTGWEGNYYDAYDGNAAIFKDCQNTANISGGNRAGGIVGSIGAEGGMGTPALKATFIDCNNSGTITGTNTNDICGAKIYYQTGGSDGLTTVIYNTNIVTITTTPSGATVVVKDYNGKAVAAEENGKYKLINGTYTYVVSKEGYKDMSGEFTVKDEGQTITVALTKIPDASPATGDNNVAPFAVAALVMAAMAMVVVRRRTN